MKLTINFILVITFFFSLSASAKQQHWQPLLDDQLSQWQAYLSYRHKEGYNGNVPTDKQGKNIKAVGLLDNPKRYGVYTTFSEQTANGTSTILKVSGEIYGGLTSRKIYRNYHLKLKFKWGDKIFDPRKKLLKDSGILYHAIGEHGKEYWRSWMVSQEFQIMRGHVGDYWSQGNSAIDIRAFLPEYVMNAVADESQPFRGVGANQSIDGFVLRKENHEKPVDQWNQLELICFEGKSLHIVNGKVVMVLQNSRTVDKNGVETPLLEGKIQLQSEAAEVFYKDIFIREITTLPQQYATLHLE
ncbi:MAG: DUF1080 domain-containing protein [Colwellia sp.]